MIKFLLDEHFRGSLGHVLHIHNVDSKDPIDFVRVGDPECVQLGTQDPEILLWAELQDRVLITFDKKTSANHLRDHHAAGHQSPGIFILRDRTTWPKVISFLTAVAYASDPDEWRDRIEYIP